MPNRIKEIGEKIKTLEDITRILVTPKAKNGGGPSWVIYDVPDGNCFGFGIYKEQRLGVQLCFCTKGTIFPKHVHEKEVEVLGVLEGSMKITTPECDEILIGEREVYRLGQGECHLVEFPDKDTWIWALTMPASEGYPDGR